VEISVGLRAVRRVATTYISKIFHYVEEVISLFPRIAPALNGFSDDKIFGDFCPHVSPLWFHLQVLISAAITVELDINI